MALATWSVAELHEAVNGVLEHVFGELTWVEGELANLSRSKAGHVYFDLVDADHDGPDSTRPSLQVALFNNDRLRVNQFLASQGGAVRMTDGIRVRIAGRLGTYASRSSLQLVMDRIDPAFTLGLLGQERARLLAELTTEGILRANAELPIPRLPLSVALVTSEGSAAHADALDELRRSGFGFQVHFLDARTQGAEAVASVVAALRTAAALPVDVIALVRGGGAATDLAAFDHELVARTIATLPIPVVTGIGHETDRTVADEVAHSAHKTPTAAAASLVGAVRDARTDVHDAWVAVRTGARGRVVRADHQLAVTGRRAGGAALRRLDRRQSALDRCLERAGAAAERTARARSDALERTVERLAPAATRVVERAVDRLATAAVRAAVHDPAAAMARGWSLTTGPDGRLVRSVADLVPGTELRTRLADGEVASRVESVRRGGTNRSHTDDSHTNDSDTDDSDTDDSHTDEGTTT